MTRGRAALAGRVAWVGLGAAFGVAGLIVALREVRVGDLGRSLLGIDGGWLVVGVVGVMLVALAKAARWHGMFAPPRPSYSAVFNALVIGQTANMLIPFRIGEVARALILKRWAGVSASLGLGTVLAEKLADLSLFGLGVALFPIWFDVPDWLRSAAWPIVLTGMVLAAVVGVLTARVRWRDSTLHRLPERMRRSLLHLFAGWSVLWSPGVRRRVWGWTLGIWTLSLVTPAALAIAMGRSLSLEGAITLLLALQITFAIPTPPGMVGVVQVACVLILVQFGFDATAAFAYGLVLNAAMVLPLALLSAAAWVTATARASAAGPLPYQ